jgi:hypothetical protein
MNTTLLYGGRKKKYDRKKTKKKSYKRKTKKRKTKKRKTKKRSYKKRKKSSKKIKSGGPSGSAITKFRAKEAKEEQERIKNKKKGEDKRKREHREGGMKLYEKGNEYLRNKDYEKAKNHYKAAGVRFSSAGEEELEETVKKGAEKAEYDKKCMELYRGLDEKALLDATIEEEDEILAQYNKDCPYGNKMPLD